MVAVWSATAGQSSFVNTAGHFCKKYGLCRSILWLITSTVTFCRCGENVYKLGRLHNVGLQCRFFISSFFRLEPQCFLTVYLSLHYFSVQQLLNSLVFLVCHFHVIYFCHPPPWPASCCLLACSILHLLLSTVFGCLLSGMYAVIADGFVLTM